MRSSAPAQDAPVRGANHTRSHPRTGDATAELVASPVQLRMATQAIFTARWRHDTFEKSHRHRKQRAKNRSCTRGLTCWVTSRSQSESSGFFASRWSAGDQPLVKKAGINSGIEIVVCFAGFFASQETAAPSYGNISLYRRSP